MLPPLLHHKNILFSENRSVFKDNFENPTLVEASSEVEPVDIIEPVVETDTTSLENTIPVKENRTYTEIVKNKIESFRNFVKKLLKSLDGNDSSHVNISAASNLKGSSAVVNMHYSSEKRMYNRIMNEIQKREK